MSEEKSKGKAAHSGVREKLRHAFAVEEEKEPLSAADEELLEKAAQFVARRRLSVPAVMMLEVLTPLSFLSSQAMIVLEPLLGPFFPRDSYAQIIKILGRRNGFDLFRQRIERLTTDSPKSGSKGS